MAAFYIITLSSLACLLGCAPMRTITQCNMSVVVDISKYCINHQHQLLQFSKDRCDNPAAEVILDAPLQALLARTPVAGLWQRAVPGLCQQHYNKCLYAVKT
jgi:hypothetical protein